MDWIEHGQHLTVSIIGSALQRMNDPATLPLLEAVPSAAWGSDKRFKEDIDHIMLALRMGVPEGLDGLTDLYGYNESPWELEAHCANLTKLWNAFHAATRTLPNETGAGEDEAPEVRQPLFRLTDPVGWWDRAAEPVDHVFDECLPCGGLGVLVGPGGGSKTTLSLQVALGVAVGRCLIPGFTPSERGSALFVTGEDPDLVNFRKLRAMPDVLNVTRQEIDHALNGGMLDMICGQPAPLLEFGIGGVPVVTDAFHELAALCTERKYRLVIVDPFAAYGGLVDENSNSAMQAGAGVFLTLAQLTGGGVMLLHHSNKSGERGGDIGQTLSRGGSALACASRAGWAVRPWCEKDCKAIGINPDRAGEFVELVQTKNSYLPLKTKRQLLRRCTAGLLVPATVEAVQSMGVLAAITRELIENPVNLTRREMAYGDASLAVAFRAGVDSGAGYDVPRKALEAAIDEGVACGRLEKRPANEGKKGSPRLEIHISAQCAPQELCTL